MRLHCQTGGQGRINKRWFSPTMTSMPSQGSASTAQSLTAHDATRDEKLFWLLGGTSCVAAENMGRLEKLRNQRRNQRKKKIKLISIRGIRTEQTCDSITVSARGTGRSGGKRLPFWGSPGPLTTVLHVENHWNLSYIRGIQTKANQKLDILQRD